MFVRRNTRTHKGKTYTNYLLVELVRTPAGPRQKTVCSLGDLGPAPRGVWLNLARKLQHALAEPGAARENMNDLNGGRRRLAPPRRDILSGDNVESGAIVSIDTHEIATERHCGIGAVHVGHEFWKRLGLDAILREVGLSRLAQRLVCAMTLNCLVAPLGEPDMPDWFRRTGLAELLDLDLDRLTEATLYEALDALHPHAAAIEAALAERERNLFNHDSSPFLCDLTSISVVRSAEPGRVGRSGGLEAGRDRSDEFIELTVALTLGREGFPLCHEAFAGGVDDKGAFEDMLTRMADRGGLTKGTIVVVDHRFSNESNLSSLKRRGLDYAIVSKNSDSERDLARFAETTGFTQIIRIPSPIDAGRQLSLVDVLLRDRHGRAYLLWHEEARVATDRVNRRRQERSLMADFDRLRLQVRDKTLLSPERIGEVIGGLKERYQRVAPYLRIAYDAAPNAVSLVRDTARASYSEQLDGASLLQTDRVDISADDGRRVCSLLTRLKGPFAEMRQPLEEPRASPHIESRGRAQILLRVLAFHLMTAIEDRLRDGPTPQSWVAVREILKSHQLCTIAARTGDGGLLRVRETASPDPDVEAIYAALGVPAEAVEPMRTLSARVGV